MLTAELPPERVEVTSLQTTLVGRSCRVVDGRGCEVCRGTIVMVIARPERTGVWVEHADTHKLVQVALANLILD